MATNAPTSVSSTSMTHIESSNTRLIIRGVWFTAILLIMGFLTAGLWVQWVEGIVVLPIQADTYEVAQAVNVPYIQIINIAMVMIFVVVGVALGILRSDDWMALTISVAYTGMGYVLSGSNLALKAAFGTNEAKIVLDTFVVITDSAMILILLAFPSGKFIPKWSVYPFVVWIMAVLLVRLQIFNPDSSGPIALFLDPGGFVLAFFAQMYHYRQSKPEQRQQTKWAILGGGIMLVSFLLFIGATTLFPGDSWLLYITYTISRIGIVAMPLGIALAIWRFRLYEVDLIINRSLVYGALAVGLGGMFVVVVVILQNLIGGGLATALAAVGVGALYQPTRRIVQLWVDRRLFGLRIGLDQLANPTPAPPILNPGALTGIYLGSYMIGDFVGRGGMGEIYRAFHPILGNDYAVKILPSEQASKEEYRLRFEREAKLMGMLKHPNIVTLQDFGIQGERYYMVMEFLQGLTLQQLLQQEKSVPVHEALQVLTPLAVALDFTHSHQVVHRDLKPSNVMCVPDGRVVLFDFGVARFDDKLVRRLTDTGLMGTLDYAAPEQIMSAKEVDHRADIYALAVMTYQMLTGELPFKGSVGQVVFAHLQQPPPDPRKINPNIPSNAAHAVLRGLSKNPDERPQTAKEFVDLLRPKGITQQSE